MKNELTFTGRNAVRWYLVSCAELPVSDTFLDLHSNRPPPDSSRVKLPTLRSRCTDLYMDRSMSIFAGVMVVLRSLKWPAAGSPHSCRHWV